MIMRLFRNFGRNLVEPIYKKNYLEISNVSQKKMLEIKVVTQSPPGMELYVLSRYSLPRHTSPVRSLASPAPHGTVS
jgi:hypothetical protein